eukprot:762961-Hanusia_phi.AAC.11
MGAQGRGLCLLLWACWWNSGGGAEEVTEEEKCFRILYPPFNHVVTREEMAAGVEVELQINCESGAEGRARLLQVYSATGDGTAGELIWQRNLDDPYAEIMAVSWSVMPEAGSRESFRNWHCSGWRQWRWTIHREQGEPEHQLLRMRAPLLEHALEQVASVADKEGRVPFALQVGAMDGVEHDHLYPFLAGGGWAGLLVEPLRDYFQSLVCNYGNQSSSSSSSSGEGRGLLKFSNKCIAEEDGRSVMYRLPPVGAGHAAAVGVTSALGGCERRGDAEVRAGRQFVSPGSLNAYPDENGLPPGMAMTLAKDKELRETVINSIVAEEVDCVSMSSLLRENSVSRVDVFAGEERTRRFGQSTGRYDALTCTPVDTEGYDLKIARQLFEIPSNVCARYSLLLLLTSRLLRSPASCCQLLRSSLFSGRRFCSWRLDCSARRIARKRLRCWRLWHAVREESGTGKEGKSAMTLTRVQDNGYHAMHCGYGMELLGISKELDKVEEEERS